MSTPPVQANESLYRQIGPGGNPIYFDPTRAQCVHRSSFLPTTQDVDGLSLIRSRFRTAIWSAHRPELPDVRFRLAVLRSVVAREVAINAGFTHLEFEPSPDTLDERFGEPWAHCTVSQINRLDYDSNQTVKRMIKEWAMGIANSVSEQVVIGPFDAPGHDDDYRPTQY